jgi:hypothetical protein
MQYLLHQRFLETQQDLQPYRPRLTQAKIT